MSGAAIIGATGGGDGDVTFQTDLGSAPVGSTVTLTSSELDITGDSGTDTIEFALKNAAVIGKVLTGYTSGAGTVAATDTILQAIQKLNGNIAAKGDVFSNTTSVSDAYLPIWFGTAGKTITGQSIFSYDDTFKGVSINEDGDTSDKMRLLVNSNNYVRWQLLGNVHRIWLQTFNSTSGTRLDLAAPASAHFWSLHMEGTSGTAGLLKLYKDDGTPVLIADGSGNIFLGQPSRATGATSGFAYMPTIAGTPTATPTARTGFAGYCFDPAAKKFWIYNTISSAWESVAVA